MGFNKSAKREVHSSASLLQQTRETSHEQLNFTPKENRKRRKKITPKLVEGRKL